MNELVMDLFPDDQVAIQGIAAELRSVVREAMPDAVEIFYRGTLGYGPTESASARIVYIQPRATYVILGFFFGSHLTDPTRLLEGHGKRLRHVKIKTLAAARTPHIKKLLREAWDEGAKMVEKLSASQKKKQPTAKSKRVARNPEAVPHPVRS